MLRKLVAAGVCSAILLVGLSSAEAKGGRAGGGSHSHSKSSGGSHSVKGHTLKSGKYVKPTKAKNPNKTQRDNYSTKGHVNPSSGKSGTRKAKK